MTDVPRSRAAVSGRSQIRRFGLWVGQNMSGSVREN